jgi:hypothetical protein
MQMLATQPVAEPMAVRKLEKDPDKVKDFFCAFALTQYATEKLGQIFTLPIIIR